MFRSASLLLLSVASVAIAAPVISNPSFEDNRSPVWPGISPILGWAGTFNTGINPSLEEQQPVFDAASGAGVFLNGYPFANNGKFPDGSNVSFLQGGASDKPGTNTVSLLQPISGFEAGKAYSVVFYCNSRASRPSNGEVYAPAIVEVFVDNQRLHGPETINPVEAALQHDVPFRKRISSEFHAPGSGPYVLKFGAYSTYVDANGSRGDSTLLLDAVSFLELGTLALTNARSHVTDAKLITADFNASLNVLSAKDPQNYSIAGNTVTKSEILSNNRSVRLTLANEIVTANPVLTIGALTDTEGRGIFRNKASQPVQFTKLRPSEIETSVRGFMDDFVGTSLQSQWKIRGAQGDFYRLSGGLLQVSPANANSHLVLEDTYSPVAQEVLARLRIQSAANPAAQSGLSVAVGSEGAGANSVLTASPSRSLMQTVDGKPESKSNAFDWQLNTWYWMRLVHAVEEGRAVTKTKVWLANDDTEEPSTFHLLDYAPAVGALQGLAGIKAPTGDMLMELDWILIKAAELPMRTVNEPTPLVPVLSIANTAEGIVVTWSRDFDDFQLEGNGLVDPFGWSLPFGGVERLPLQNRYVVAPEDPAQYFRLTR